MQNSGEINDIGFSPSFNCYSTNNSTYKAAAKVNRESEEQDATESHECTEIEEDDFEFSLEFSSENFSSNELAFNGRILLPIFNTDLVTKDDVDLVDSDSSISIPLQNLLPGDGEQYLSTSHSELEESEDESSRTFCVSWRKADIRSPLPADIKKSKSTGSGESESRRWRIKDMIRRSNSLGKETVYFLCPKRVEESCKKGIVKSVEAPKVAGKLKPASFPSIHELFYVQKRAEQKVGKMKSYLPYRQDILGFKVHINGDVNTKLPF